MLKNVFLAIFIGLCFTITAQQPNDVIKIKSPNETYLEHLIKIKLDSVRAQQNMPMLANDSGLYVTSKFHCNYLSKSNKTSHSQMNDTLRTLNDRLAFFDVEGYMTKELVHSIYIHRPISIKPNPNEKIKQKITFTTYNNVANYFVTQWTLNKKTKPHLTNPKFNVIGLSVTVNKTNDNIKTVAILGRPFLKYQFVENKEMFPHSSYQTPPVIESFNEVQKKLLETRPYKIDLKDASKCEKCVEYLDNIDLNLRVSGSKIFVQASNIENIEGFTKFISSDKNGFMLETLEYEDYHPGNPAYYQKPTRRNKTYIYNGEISAPQFGDVLQNGFNAAKGTFKSYLAKKPKIKTYHEYNLYVVFKGMLCQVKRFTSPVGDPMALYTPLKLGYQFDSSYTHMTQGDTTEYDFSFDKQYFNFDKDLLTKEILNNIGFDSVKVKLVVTEPMFYYDLDSAVNFDSVYYKLVNNVKQMFPNIKLEISRATDSLFFKEIDALKDKTKDELKTIFEDPLQVKKYAQILKKSWSAKFIYISYFDDLLDMQQQYVKAINKIDSTEEPLDSDIKKAISLHSAMLMESVSRSIPLSLEAAKIPRFRIPVKTIIANQVAYNYNSIQNPSKDTLNSFYTKYLKPIYKGTLAIKEDRINFLKFSCNHLSKKPFDGLYRSNHLTADLEKLAPQLTKNQNERLNKAFDIKLTYYYSFYPKAASKFEKAINKMVDIYGDKSIDVKYKLALTLAYYNKYDAVNEIINPYIGQGDQSENMIILSNKINQEYQDVFGNESMDYYTKLISSFDNLGAAKWCSQFVGDGNISFQIFDYLPLYHKYCDECAPYKNAGTEITY